MYTGEFTDAHGTKIQLKFPASIVEKYIPSIARGSYSEIRKYGRNIKLFWFSLTCFIGQLLKANLWLLK